MTNYPNNMTTSERRLSDFARRIAEKHGRRCLGLNDGYSGALYVLKMPTANGDAYMIRTSDGGTGFLLGRTVTDARLSLADHHDYADDPVLVGP